MKNPLCKFQAFHRTHFTDGSIVLRVLSTYFMQTVMGSVILTTGCTGMDAANTESVDQGEWHSSLKQAKSLGHPWEKEIGYAQGVRARDTIYVAGQFGVDHQGNLVDREDMRKQLRQAYANVAAVLTQYGATLSNVVHEVIFVTDMDTALTVAPDVRREVFLNDPQVTTTLIQVDRLAFPEALVVVQVTAEMQFLPPSRGGRSGFPGRGGSMPGGMGRGRGGMGGGGFPPF